MTQSRTGGGSPGSLLCCREHRGSRLLPVPHLAVRAEDAFSMNVQTRIIRPCCSRWAPHCSGRGAPASPGGDFPYWYPRFSPWTQVQPACGCPSSGPGGEASRRSDRGPPGGGRWLCTRASSGPLGAGSLPAPQHPQALCGGCVLATPAHRCHVHVDFRIAFDHSQLISPGPRCSGKRAGPGTKNQ